MCPMGILNDVEFEKEMGITIKRESPEEAVVEDIKLGRPPASKNVPPEIREIVARSALNEEGTGKQIADSFGVSESSVSAYKVGAHSTTTYHQPDERLRSAVIDHKVRISTKARNRLISALNEITPDRLSGVKPRDLASIAKDMSSIVKDMEPAASSSSGQTNIQFTFMAPRVKDINEFNIIDVKD